MRTTAFRYAVMLAVVTLLAVWSAPVQGESAASKPDAVRVLGAGDLSCERPAALVGSLPQHVSAFTTASGDNINLGAAGSCYGGGPQAGGTGTGEDDIWVVATDADCPLTLTMTPTVGVDLALYVISPDCSSVAENCIRVDDDGVAGVTEQVEFEANAGQYYLIVVDGYNGSSGGYSLVIETAGTCSLVDLYSSVGDKQFLDADMDGIQDPGEVALELGVVNLYQCAGPLLAQFDLTVHGHYDFGGLLPSEYYLEFVPPAGYEFSPKDQGEDDTLDSDVEPEDGKTPCFATQAGVDDLTWDAGVHPETFTLGDRAWYDTDWDGIQDSAEVGIEGVGMVLDSGSCDAGTGPTEVTNALGLYAFEDVVASTYCISNYSVPSGTGTWQVSPRDVGEDDTVDSDFDPTWVNSGLLSVSADNVDLDLGLYVEGYIGGTVWCDANGNQLKDAGEGTENVQTWLYSDPECDMIQNAQVDQYGTESNGWYDYWDLHTGPPGGPPECYVVVVDVAGMGACSEPLTSASKPIAVDASQHAWTGEDFGFREPTLLSLGDRVWYDTDQDGIQDPGESGVPGVDVDLHANSGCQGSPQASSTTGPAGLYGFSGLSAGTYCLDFAGGIPAPFLLTAPNNGGDDSLDSDVDIGTQRIENISLSASNTTYDAGLVAFGQIEGRVFCDHDGDGLFDVDEFVDGVTTGLYKDTNCDASEDALWLTRVTAIQGFFGFNPVPVGPPGGPPLCYVVQVDVAGMGDCDIPLTSNERALALTVDNRVSTQNHVGFTDLTGAENHVYLPLVFRSRLGP